MKYQTGQSGNPKGKPRGSLNKHTKMVQLLEPHAEKLINKMVEMALAGDSNALRLCIERIIPKVKQETLTFPVINLKDKSNVEIVQEIKTMLLTQEMPLEQAHYFLNLLKCLSNNLLEQNQTKDIDRVSELVKKYVREY